jgi:hypothetical protein
VIVQGITFDYGWFGIHAYVTDARGSAVNTTNLTIRDKTIKHIVQSGLMCYGDNMLVQDNLIDMVGLNDGWWFRTAGPTDTQGWYLSFFGLMHCAYLVGNGIRVRDNFLGRSYGGFCLQAISPHGRFHDNVLYRGSQGSFLLNGVGSRFVDNIAIQHYQPRWSNCGDSYCEEYQVAFICGTAAGLSIVNNYLEGAQPIGNRNAEGCTFSDFVIQNNVLNNTEATLPSWRICNETLGLANAAVENNLWMGYQEWMFTRCPIVNGARQIAFHAQSFKGWQGYLSLYPQTRNWEQHSAALPSAGKPVFDFARFETLYLNVDFPNLDAVLPSCRDYWTHTIAPLVPRKMINLGPILSMLEPPPGSTGTSLASPTKDHGD